MGVKKFVRNAVNLLELDKFSVEGKKESLLLLLDKLEHRKKRLEKILEKKDDKAIKENLKLTKHQIEKGKKHLEKLSK